MWHACTQRFKRRRYTCLHHAASAMGATHDKLTSQNWLHSSCFATDCALLPRAFAFVCHLQATVRMFRPGCLSGLRRSCIQRCRSLVPVLMTGNRVNFAQDLACCCRAIASACSKCVSALLMSGSGASHAISPRPPRDPMDVGFAPCFSALLDRGEGFICRNCIARASSCAQDAEPHRSWTEGAMGTILKQNGYATSWFGKNHHTPGES
jgi:hypothetical protein